MLSKRALCKIKINNTMQQLLFSLHHVFFRCIMLQYIVSHSRCTYYIALYCITLRTYKNLNLHGSHVGVTLMCLCITLNGKNRNANVHLDRHCIRVALRCIAFASRFTLRRHYVGIVFVLYYILVSYSRHTTSSICFRFNCRFKV